MVCANGVRYGSQATVDGHLTLNQAIRVGSTPTASTIFFVVFYVCVGIYYMYMKHKAHMSNDKDLLKEFLAGGWLVAIIGAAGMIARLLSDDTKTTIKEQIKKVVTASICSVIVWFLLENIDLSSLTKAIIYGITGVISPEILQGLSKLAHQFAKNPKRFIKK